MESKISKLTYELDSIIRFLTPLLPIANCHMVEFISQNHWEKLLPASLRESLDKLKFHNAIERFWKAAECPILGNSELDNWISSARRHCVTANNDYCLTPIEFQDKLLAWGGQMTPEILIKEFMTKKKSYEVQTMSRLVSTLYSSCEATCCVEVGGGRGHLLAALTLGYGVPSLTVDCDPATVDAAAGRVKLIQKQWHAIAKQPEGLKGLSDTRRDLHRFAAAYVTADTDLASIVKDHFPEHRDIRPLLTGLHTCGNLGPDSLRIFSKQQPVAAVFNVPCCYHLLTEDQDDLLYDVFHKEFGIGTSSPSGFPMSEHLRGFNLGRNARMLAAQSIDRVVGQRQMPARSLLYRALLQVIIKKYKPDDVLPEGKLKRLSKCEDFPTYFKMANSILKLELVDSDVTDLDCQWKKMVLFYLLRLCLAQVVESVILLDRLLFLYENGFQEAFLVKLFEPIMSPRCHGIVAVR